MQVTLDTRQIANHGNAFDDYELYSLCWRQNSDYEGIKAFNNPKYKDRAETRRGTVGSEGSFFRDDSPSSVHV